MINQFPEAISWIIKFSKPVDFIGRKALEKQKQEGISEHIIYFILDSRRIAREGTPILCENKVIGKVVSGTLSPMLNKAIGSALIDTNKDYMNKLYIDLHGSRISLRPKKPPLHC